MKCRSARGKGAAALALVVERSHGVFVEGGDAAIEGLATAVAFGCSSTRRDHVLEIELVAFAGAARSRLESTIEDRRISREHDIPRIDDFAAHDVDRESFCFGDGPRFLRGGERRRSEN